MRRPGPPRVMRVVLTRELIVHTAVELVEREGPDALSMRAVGDELGVSAMAIYRHLGGKDALLGAIAEYIMATFDMSQEPSADWKNDARDLMRAFRAVSLEFPRSLALVLESRTGMPIGLRAIERALALCALAGLDRVTGVHVVRSMMAFTLGSQLREAGLGRLLARRQDDATETVRALSGAEMPHVAALPVELLDQGSDADFSFGVELFLEAVELLSQARA